MNFYAGGSSGIDITITVKEDGIETCKGKSNCSFWNLRQCNKEQTFARGGRNSMMVHFNLIKYESRKYNAQYPISVDLSAKDHKYDLKFCCKFIPLCSMGKMRACGLCLQLLMAQHTHTETTTVISRT